MYPSKLGARPTGIHAARLQDARRDLLTLRYKEETLQVEKLPDLTRLNAEQQQQIVLEHLQSVICMFLSTDTGRGSFSIHGSTAITMILRELTTPQEVRALEMELGIPPEFYLPMSNREIHDIDLACTLKDLDIKAIEKLLNESMKGNEHYCKIEATQIIPIGDVFCVRKPGTTHEQRFYLETCRCCTINATIDNRVFLSLDIVYPPDHEQQRHIEIKKPYIKDSKTIKVTLGRAKGEIKTSTLTEIFDSLLSSNKATPEYKPAENKFNHRIKLLISLENKKLIDLQGASLWDRLLSSTEPSKPSAPISPSVGLQTETIVKVESGTNTITVEQPKIHQESQTVKIAAFEKNTQTVNPYSNQLKSKEVQTKKLKTRNTSTQYKKTTFLEAEVKY